MRLCRNLTLTGEAVGIGIIDIAAIPITVSLVNAGVSTLFYSSTVPLTAALAVVEDDDAVIQVQPAQLVLQAILAQRAIPALRAIRVPQVTRAQLAT